MGAAPEITIDQPVPTNCGELIGVAVDRQDGDGTAIGTFEAHPQICPIGDVGPNWVGLRSCLVKRCPDFDDSRPTFYSVGIGQKLAGRANLVKWENAVTQDQVATGEPITGKMRCVAVFIKAPDENRSYLQLQCRGVYHELRASLLNYSVATDEREVVAMDSVFFV